MRTKGIADVREFSAIQLQKIFVVTILNGTAIMKWRRMKSFLIDLGKAKWAVILESRTPVKHFLLGTAIMV